MNPAWCYWGTSRFLDPPKETAAQAIAKLREHGIQVKVLTGDNDAVTRKICSQVGLEVEHIVLGSDIENMSDEGWRISPGKLRYSRNYRRNRKPG